MISLSHAFLLVNSFKNNRRRANDPASSIDVYFGCSDPFENLTAVSAKAYSAAKIKVLCLGLSLKIKSAFEAYYDAASSRN